ncbi:MAG: hypothetical protein IPH20_16545 [Bacteroidales bacterium]|nr:hypothetical protein [Bacteroidales bacterium]
MKTFGLDKALQGKGGYQSVKKIKKYWLSSIPDLKPGKIPDQRMDVQWIVGCTEYVVQVYR